MFETGEGFQSLVAPSGLSSVPFTWHDAATGRRRRMEAVGGLVGVGQDADTLALRPKAGWAVKAAPKLDVLLERLAAGHTTFPGTRVKDSFHVPEELCAFYHRTDGAELFGRGADAAVRILPAAGMEPLDWGEPPEQGGNSRGPGGRTWHRLARLADGGWLAINLDINKHRAPWRDRPDLRERQQALGYDHFAPICRGSDETRGQPGRNPVVALSFSELLERLLDGDGTPYWLDPAFAGYGDAELYTPRE